MDKQTQAIITVTGLSSVVGHFLLPRLLAAGYHVQALSREDKSLQNTDSIVWYKIHPDHIITPAIKVAPILIHLAPLWVLPEILPSLVQRGVTRVIAFGSTSVYGKQNSQDQYEQEVVKKLNRAEHDVAIYCREHHIPWTILRPTLIYGAGLDKNIALIERFIKRFSFFPLFGAASGLRQPVYADDLAQACLQVLDNPKTYNKAYNLTGGETLSYRAMVQCVFVHLHKRVNILSIPRLVFRIALSVLSCLPGFQRWNIAMVDRMNQDLCFDSSEAVHDFGYHARKFMSHKS